MKKLLLYIASILFIIIAFDFLVGVCCKYYIKNHQLTGRYEPLDRLLKTVNSDILIIGNSIILNSLDPKTIEDSLSQSCYNGGIIGQGIDFSETIIDCVLQRYTPKTIILGLRPEEMGGNIGDGIYDILRPYYNMGYTSIDEHLESYSGSKRILLHSNLIRYNTIWIRVILYMFFDKSIYPQNGFMPKEVPLTLAQQKIMSYCATPSKEKLETIERIIKKCKTKGINIVICFPPTLQIFPQKPIPCVEAVEQICKKNNSYCITNYDCQYYQERPELFFDDVHLNINGAKLYSKDFANQLKQIK